MSVFSKPAAVPACFLIILALLAGLYPLYVQASDLSRPDSHAPIGVMGDHTHHRGEFMFSYRYMHMSMRGNRDGHQSLTPEQIATSVPNGFANPPMQPPFLRVVPTEMTMDMHMLGMMYAPSNRVTLMAMLNYVDMEMQHITFMGPMGANRLGTFTTRTNGIGDTSLSALINWLPTVHMTLGLSLPTGDIEQTDTILTPTNTRPSPRLPYPMQLGSGTYDPIVGLTYRSSAERWSWGAQWRSKFRFGENDSNYTLGDEHRVSGWAAYRLGAAISMSGRLELVDRGNISGQDPVIVAPVQTADPNRQGYQRVDAKIGFNTVLPGGKHRFALEFSKPISQNLDGPQMETDWQASLGWQYAP